MTNYNLVNTDGVYRVEGLATWTGEYPHTLLLVRYDAGDYDNVTENNELMHRALYDLFQTSDALKDGDTFSINDVVQYICEGVHVRKVAT